MKNIVRIVAVVLAIATPLPVTVFAAEAADANTIFLEDGSYITVEVEENGVRASSTKSGRKTYTYRSNSGEEHWKAVLTGTFTYTGTASTCTVSTCTVTITNTNWYVISKTTSKSGGTAYADLTMGRKVFGITADRETINMYLTCDKSGNLS